MAATVGTAYINILPSTSALAPGIKRSLARVDTAPEGKRAGGRFSGALAGALKTAGKAGLVGAAVAAGATVVSGFKAGIDQQKSSATLAGLYNSTDVAETLMKRLRKVSQTSVIDYGTYTKTAEALAYMGIEGKDAPKMLENIGDAIAGAGGGSQEMDRASDALLKMVNAGKVQLDTLNQLSDSGVPIYSALADEQGVSIAKLREMVTAGEVGIEDVQSAIRNASGESWDMQIKSAKKGEKTLSGRFSILKDNVTTSLGTMFEPAVSGLGDFVGKVNDGLFGGGGGGGMSDGFKQIGDAARTLWTRDVKPALSEMGRFIKDDLGPVLKDLWENVAKPVFRFLGEAIRVWWNYYAKPILRALWWLLKNVIFPVIRAWYYNVVKPIFQWVSKAISNAWNNHIKPAFTRLKEYLLRVVFPVLRDLWNNVVKPVMAKVGSAIKFAWNRVIKPIFAAWKWYFQNVLWPVIRFLWDKVVKPVMKKVGDRIKSAWNNVIKPVFKALGSFIRETVAPAFRKGVDAIGRAWGRIKQLARAPIAFVINTVYGKGIKPLFDNAMKGLGSDTRLPAPPKMGGFGSSSGGGGGTGKLKQASGGVLPGWTPGRDVHHFRSPTAGELHLSGGEAIMRPEFTRAVGGKRGVDRLNALARRGMAFAGGGVWMPGSRSQHTSGYSFARWAGDINSPNDLGKPVPAYRAGIVAAVKHLTSSYGKHVRINHPSTGENTLYAHLSRIAVRAGQKVTKGQTIGNVGSTGNSTGPHLHFEIRGGNAPISSGGGGAVDVIRNLVSSGISKLKSGVKSRLSALAERFGTKGFAHMGDLSSRKMLGAAVSKIRDEGDKHFGDDSALRGVMDALGPVTGAVKGVRGVAKAFGWARGANWKALVDLVNRESSWNPSAANPTSSARGLFQKMTGTHGAVESTPAGQAMWGLNYIRNRYGNPLNAIRFHNANNWYANGGVYDSGGVLGPGGTAVNLSRKPEVVFTGDQWSTLQRAARLGETSGGRGDMRPIQVIDNTGNPALTAREVARREAWAGAV